MTAAPTYAEIQIMYAINVTDLSSVFPAPGLAGMLLGDFCNAASHIVDCEKGYLDGGAVVLDGPAAQDAERTEALLSLLQTGPYARRLGRPVRVYQQGPRGGWKKIKAGKTS